MREFEFRDEDLSAFQLTLEKLGFNGVRGGDGDEELSESETYGLGMG
jgi:hypothetical protein